MKPPEKIDNSKPKNKPAGDEAAVSTTNLVVFALFTVSIFAAGMSIAGLVGKNQESKRPAISPPIPTTAIPEIQPTKPERQPEPSSPALQSVFAFPEPAIPETKVPMELPVTVEPKSEKMKPPPPPPSPQLLSELLLKHQAKDTDVDDVLADTAATAIACYSLLCQIHGGAGLEYEQMKALLVNPKFTAELTTDIRIINESLSPPGNTALSVCPDCSSHIKKALKSSKRIHQDISRYFCKDAANTSPALVNIIATAGNRKKPNSQKLKAVQHALQLLSDTQSDRIARQLLTIPDQSRRGTVSFFIVEALRRGIERGGWSSMFEAVPSGLDSLRLPLQNTGKQRRACMATWRSALDRARRQPILRTTPHTPSPHRIKQRQLVFVRRTKLLACVDFWLRKISDACQLIRNGKPVPAENFLPAKCMIDPVTMEQQLTRTTLLYLQLPQIIIEQQRHGKEAVHQLNSIKTKCAGEWFAAETVLQKTAVLFSNSAKLMRFALKKKDALPPAIKNHANALVRLRYEVLRNLRLLELFHRENQEVTLHISSSSPALLPSLSSAISATAEPRQSLHQLPKLRKEVERLRKLLSNSPSDKKVIDRLLITLRHLSIHKKGAFQSLADGLQLYLRNEPYLAASLLEQAAESSDATLLFHTIMKKDLSDIIQFCRKQYQPKADCKQCGLLRYMTCDSCHGFGYSLCKQCSGSGKPDKNSRATVLPMPHCAACNGFGGHPCDTCAGTGQMMCRECAPEKNNHKPEINRPDFERLQDIIHIARWRSRGVIDLYTSYGIR